jgi:hypothetical protein
LTERDEDLVACMALRRHLAEDPRGKASRRAVEKLSDGFGERVRIMPMVEVLERRGTISARQARAGARIYECWALGVLGAHDAEPTGNGSDPDGYSVARVEAANEYRRIRDAVGGRLWPCAFAVCCEDWSPQRWANERGGGERSMHKLGAVALLRVALDIAADVIGDE